jgi:hypothetical protein
MFASVVGDVLSRVGPFVIPVVVFAGGVTAYALLWLFYRLRDRAVTEDDSAAGE